MIFRLLIVDDEAPIRKGLSSFINWEAIDCEVAGTACDGAEAVELLKKMNIHIVLTDIKMPELDGLGLAKYIYENYPDIRVIILTGYAEFEYAQTAIRYNVVQFLLKPTSKDEVVQAVQAAQQKIITSKQHALIAKDEIAFLKDQLFQHLTESAPAEDSFQKLHDLGIDLTTYYIAAFQPDHSVSDVTQLKELIIDQKANSYCYRYNNLILNIYFHENLDFVVDNCTEISQIFSLLHDGASLSIGISKKHHSVAQFRTAASETITALSLTFYSASSIAVFSGQSMSDESFLSADITLSLYELENAILSLDFPSAASLIGNLFSQLQANLTNAEDAKNICSQIYYLIFRVTITKRMVPPSEEILIKIRHAADIFELRSLIDDLTEFARASLTSSKKQYSTYVENAIAYINEHFTENLTLRQIAKHSHINDSYLSRTFKKECGYSLTEYISTLRIEQVKHLLADQQLLTYEVAEKTGFNDPSYFSLQFKKYTGLSPREYRNQFVHQEIATLNKPE